MLLYLSLEDDRRWWQGHHANAHEAFEHLREGRIRPEDLSAAKTRILGRFRIRFSRNGAIADLGATAPPDLLSGMLLRTLEAVSIEDVRRFCARNFVEQNRFFVLSKPILTATGMFYCAAVLGTVLVILALALLVKRIHRRRATVRG